MLASGQFGTELKKEYIKDKKENFKNANDSPLKTSDSSEVIGEQASPPIEYFTRDKKRLLLNQESMIPKEEAKNSQQSQDNKQEKEDLATTKLNNLVDKSSDVLVKVSTVFPFTLFTNDVIVDPYKVNIIFREFFYSQHIHSILVKDILDIVVETSLFFATVKIVDQGYVENSVNITYLKKADALKLRKIIQGLVIAHRQAIDLSVLHPDNIRDKVEELGQVGGIDDTKQNRAAL